MVKAIVGANWGDEGKGKVTDMLARQSDVVVRFQGGANAGHTIINGYGRFALHTLPSGVFYPHVTNVIGNGVALDIAKLADELEQVETQGVPAPRLIVSDRTQLLMPYHILQDTYEETRLGGRAFGSTKSGIAPFYSDKYAKTGIQVCDLFDEPRLRERLTAAVELKNVLFEHLYHQPPRQCGRAHAPAPRPAGADSPLRGGHGDLPLSGPQRGQNRPSGGPAGLHEGP